MAAASKVGPTAKPLYGDNSGEKMEIPQEFEDSPQQPPFTINVSKSDASPVPILNLGQIAKVSPVQMLYQKPPGESLDTPKVMASKQGGRMEPQEPQEMMAESEH